MITVDQINILKRKFQINETTIYREYVQILFLSILYSANHSNGIFFKGGTAIHLIFKSPRFSEDLDFTVDLPVVQFTRVLREITLKLQRQEELFIKEKKTLTGKRFLLTVKPFNLSYPIFVNLDFSFREKVLSPQKSILETDYPVLFTSYVFHLSAEELFAEKIRALLTRKKGRDLYDLWYLSTKNVEYDSQLVRKKLEYYHLTVTTAQEIKIRVNQFIEKDFTMDMRPFVPLPEREKLPEFFTYIKTFLNHQFTKNT